MAMICFTGLCHGWADPIITRQPQSQAVSLGSEVVFSIEATGEEPTPEKFQAHANAVEELIAQVDSALAQVNDALAQVDDALAQVDDALAQVDDALAQVDSAITQLEAADPNSPSLATLKWQRENLLRRQHTLAIQKAELEATKAPFAAQKAELLAYETTLFNRKLYFENIGVAKFYFNAENNFLTYQWVRCIHSFGKETIDLILNGTLPPDQFPVPMIMPIDGATANTLSIPSTQGSDFGLYAVEVSDAFFNRLFSHSVWLREPPILESPKSISQSGHMLIKFNSQFGGFIERSRNLVDWVTFINVPAGMSEISVNINADDHEFFRLKEQN